MEDVQYSGDEGGESGLNLLRSEIGGAPGVSHNHDHTTDGDHVSVHLPDLPVDPSSGGNLAAGIRGIIELQLRLYYFYFQVWVNYSGTRRNIMILMPGPPPPGSWGYQAMPPSQMHPQEWSSTGEPPVNPPQQPQEDLQAQGTPPPSYYSLAPQPEAAQGQAEAGSQSREPEARSAEVRGTDENNGEDAPAEGDRPQEVDQEATREDGETGDNQADQQAGASQGGPPVGGQLHLDQGPVLRPRPTSLGLSAARRRRRRPRYGAIVFFKN